jgi:hypothetical protein
VATEIDRVRAILDEQTFPRDAALLSRTASALDRRADQIVRWAKPTRSVLCAAGTALFNTALFGLGLVAVIRVHVGAGVACAAVCLAGAFVAVLVSEVWPAGWIDASVEHRKLAAEIRRAADMVLGTNASTDATGVRADPGVASEDEEAATTTGTRARKAGTE